MKIIYKFEIFIQYYLLKINFNLKVKKFLKNKQLFIIIFFYNNK